MHAMHIRRYDETAQHAVERHGDPVIEEARVLEHTATGIRTLPWLNIDVTFSRTSNTRTAATGGPNAAIAVHLMSIDSRISAG